MPGDERVSPPGLRERRKQQIRQSLLDAAARLFEERGYDQVTVAQIAEAAGTTVKTMFTYFRSKEELAFGEQDVLLEELVAAAGHAGPLGVVDAVADVLRFRLAGSSPEDVLAGTLSYHRGYGESAALQNGLRRMWAHYEDALTAAIAAARPELESVEARLLAMRAVLLVRSMTTAELRDLLQQTDDPRAAMLDWIEHAARSLDPSPRPLLRREAPATAAGADREHD